MLGLNPNLSLEKKKLILTLGPRTHKYLSTLFALFNIAFHTIITFVGLQSGFLTISYCPSVWNIERSGEIGSRTEWQDGYNHTSSENSCKCSSVVVWCGWIPEASCCSCCLFICFLKVVVSLYARLVCVCVIGLSCGGWRSHTGERDKVTWGKTNESPCHLHIVNS